MWEIGGGNGVGGDVGGVGGGGEGDLAGVGVENSVVCVSPEFVPRHISFLSLWTRQLGEDTEAGRV